ncbi:glutathione S-transferase C-terminal domain-containing protein, partial [Streptomyces brasiliscabiei]
GWAVAGPAFFRGVPGPVRPVVASLIRRRIRAALHGQGYGRHTAAQIYGLGVADLAAIATLIADRPFAVADRPSTVDAVLYAFLATILVP